MPNMSLEKNPMPVQEPAKRVKNFAEVALGYTKEQAVEEAKRCLGCKHKPCVAKCPVAIDIPGFIGKVAEADFAGAYAVLNRSTSLPAVCGRVCPQESQCESTCVRGKKGEPVGIGYLERFVADWHRTRGVSQDSDTAAEVPQSNGHQVAVIGAGPAGLTAAGDLAKMGYQVTVFEALHMPGGVLVYGIPAFRLPKDIIMSEIDQLRKLGVKIELNHLIGRILTVDELFTQGFEAVFIGTGAGLPNFMNIPGEGLNGVYSANEYLTRINLMQAYKEDSKTPVLNGKRVAVVGGGNVAMDAVRCAKRLGADEACIVYRRSMEELPARAEEVEHAIEEGVQFKLLASPVEIMGDADGNVTGMRCNQMKLGEPDASGRRRPVVLEGGDFTLDVDLVIMAIGTSPNPLIHNTTPSLEVNKWGCLITQDERGETSRQGVYAGGDAVTGAATVILAMGAGKEAAQAIDAYIQNKA